MHIAKTPNDSQYLQLQLYPQQCNIQTLSGTVYKFIKCPKSNGSVIKNKATQIKQQQRLRSQHQTIWQQHWKEQYEQEMSLIKSSLTMDNVQTYCDIKPQIMQKLESDITKQILILREQKIMLIELLSLKIDYHNDVILEVARKNNPKSTQKLGNTAPKQQYKQHKEQHPSESDIAIVFQKSDELKCKLLQLQEMRLTTGESRMDDIQIEGQLAYCQRKCLKLEQQLQDKKKLLKQKQPNRFVTFFPQDKRKELQISQLRQQVKQLQQYKQQLEQKSSTQTNSAKEEDHLQDYLSQLKSENTRLIQQAQLLIQRQKQQKPAKFTQLQTAIQHNQRHKMILYEQMRAMKYEMEQLKRENAELKSQQQVY